MATTLETREGKIIGPWRKPTNRQGQGTNIHNDDDARALGFRGGLVAGSIHMEMFVPLLLEAFGDAWFETGNLSMYFKFATLHNEEVRALVGVPENGGQVEVHGERPDGTVIGEGTASAGTADAVSALSARDLSKYPAGELRILENVNVGDEFDLADARVTPEAHQERLGVVTETIPAYTDPERWGGLVASPAAFVNVLGIAGGKYLAGRLTDPVVGLFGAIEIRNVNGPLLVDTPYRAGGVVRAVGQSPKTEFYWHDTFVEDPDGKRIAEMRMMTRFMKESSVLYNEEAVTKKD